MSGPETSPDPPPAAGLVFGDRIELARSYAELLAGPGIDRGLIGPAEAARIWPRHLLNCAALSSLIATGTSVLDIGSGAGLPGLVLAIARPDLRVRCIEAKVRAATFLDEVIARLELDNAAVLHARAEELPGRVAAPVVTARAAAPLPRLIEWAAPLLEPGGQLLALKGRTAAREVAAARAQLVGMGGATVEPCLIAGERYATVVRIWRDRRREVS